METSKHYTNSKTKQRHEHRHIIQTHLTYIAKTLEKTLLPYITNNIPHISTQHGFKSNHSTSTALHNINNTIATGFNQNKPPERTITVALDRRKAFDTVNIHTLTHKLHQTNIQSNTSQTTSKDAKHTPHSETKHQHTANSKMVFHKAVFYHPQSSTYTHLPLLHHRHQKTDDLRRRHHHNINTQRHKHS